MANTVQARKRARQATEQRAHNMSLRSTLRTAIKKVRKAIDAGDKSAAQAVFKESQPIIDSIADKNIVHKNLAALSLARRYTLQTKRLPSEAAFFCFRF
ncbi:MAG: small subunit ribosomal protein S20 [Rhodocyclaceae bacterium]|nr:MAG: small subunit ribosomal protein S20 [Rhodocyclaceae bacterium]